MDRTGSKPGELPVGFINTLAQHTEAMNRFCSLNEGQREQIVSYIQVSSTGDEAQSRVRTAVDGLAHGNLGFLQGPHT